MSGFTHLGGAGVVFGHFWLDDLDVVTVEVFVIHQREGDADGDRFLTVYHRITDETVKELYKFQTDLALKSEKSYLKPLI